MAVAITLLPSGNQSGGNVADTIQTTEYSTALVALTGSAVVNGCVSVTTPTAADGTAMKSRMIPISSIKQVVTL